MRPIGLIAHISSNPLISRPLDGSKERPQALVTYIESMRKTREMPAEIVLSGHGEPITDHATLIDDRIAKHDRRKEKSYSLIAEQPRSGYELAQAIWGNVAVTQAFLTLSEVIRPACQRGARRGGWRRRYSLRSNQIATPDPGDCRSPGLLCLLALGDSATLSDFT